MAFDPASLLFILLLFLGLPLLLVVGGVMLARGAKASQDGEFDPKLQETEQETPVHHVVSNEPRRTEPTAP